MATEFTRYPGGLQAALVPVGRSAPPDAEELGLGITAIVLGSDQADHQAQLGDGDSVVVTQTTSDVAGPRIRFLYSLDLRGGLPEGWAWHERVKAGAEDIERPIAGGIPTAQIRHLRDRAINAAGMFPGDQVLFGLVLRRTDPEAEVPATVELPGVWLDAVLDDDPGPLWLANRVPEPNATAIPHSWSTLELEVHSTSLEPLDLATLELEIAGEVAISAGEIQAPFTGSILLDAPNLFVTLEIGSLTPASSEIVDVLLTVETTGGLDVLNETWSWVWSDTIVPTIVEVGEATPLTLWVWASEDLADPPGGEFSLTPTDGPGYVPEVLAVTRISSTLFELTLDEELTIGRVYELSGALVDLEGNQGTSSISFAVSRFRPADRRVDVFNWFPTYNRKADEGGLLLFARLVQDAFEKTLTRKDHWRWILHPDRCPARYLPAILLSYGCPWPPDLLTETQQRRLATALVSIMQLSGTSPGLIEAARVILGLTVEVRTGTESDWWVLEQGTMDVDTILAPDAGSPLWYTFWFDYATPGDLTADQLAWLDRIANTLRGAQEHYGGLYEASTSLYDFWILETDALDVDAILGA